MISALFRELFELGLWTTGAFLFVALLTATEIGFRLGRRAHPGRGAKSEDLSAISTLTAGMIGLLAFTLSLSINFAQGRYETRRGLVLTEANAIGTAWLRARLIDAPEGPAIAAAVEEYARVRVDFTATADAAAAPALVAQTNALQSGIWRSAQEAAHRAPNPVTVSLINALNDMFDNSLSQQFAYQSRVPAVIMLALFFGSLLSIGALSYQFGLANKRQMVLSSLLLLMWSGGMLLIVDLDQPRSGSIRPDVSPLLWTIQGFRPG